MSIAVTSNSVSHFQDARTLPDREQVSLEADGLPAGSLGRGLLFALPISALMWFGIVAAARAIF